MSSNDSAIDKAISYIKNADTPISDLLNPKIRRATLLWKNKKLLHAFRERLQSEISNLAIPSKKDIFYEGNISNYLSYITYTEPKTGEHITLPIYLESHYQWVDFTITRINLTHDHISSPYTAYALTSIKSTAPSFLLLMGTTFPTGKGFSQALLGDTAPGGGVGYFLYYQAKDILQRWIREEFLRTKQPIICCGQSLGGALAMQIYIHQPSQVKFTIFNPPYLTTAEESIYLSHTDDKTTDNHIFVHTEDPVRDIGHWLPDECLVHLHGTKHDSTLAGPSGSIKAHALKIPDQSTKFLTMNGSVYRDKIRSEDGRYARHYAMKVAKPVAFFSISLATGIAAPVRSLMKRMGITREQHQGPQTSSVEHESKEDSILIKAH